LSLIAFLVGGSTVAYGGFGIVRYKDAQPNAACWQLQELQGKIYRTNICSGVFEVVVQALPEVDSLEPPQSQPTEPHSQSLKGDAAKATRP